MSDLEKQDAGPFREELRDYRQQLNLYFEKLAVLNGATVALVITGVLGPFHDRIVHKHFLLAALTVQVLGLVVLLYRNLRAIHYEQASTAAWHGEERNQSENYPRLNNLLSTRQKLEKVGQWLTVLGILLLLANAWLIFW
jgi:hypothetical protein